MKIWVDMDGTIAGLYAVNGWLEMLIASDPTPYAIAKPLVRMATLARLLNNAQKHGHEICVISWCSKSGTNEYNELVKQAKMAWLAKHLPSVKWNEIKIVPYGQNKWETCKTGILFDDEEKNRDCWETGKAFEPCDIMKILKMVIHE